jgi:ABC-type molybdate transport system substrate-binding protein
MSAATPLYNSLATVGRVSATVWFWLSILIAIVLLVAGVYYLFFAEKRSTLVGVLCFAGASLVVALSWLDRYFTRHYKPYAAASGGFTIIDGVSELFD